MRKRVNSQKTYSKDSPSYFLGSIRKKTSKSISNSTMNISNGVQLPNSFYNDRNTMYLSKSQVLSEKRSSFQSKQITYSQRKKYQSTKLQTIINKRQTVQDDNLETFRKKQAKKRYQNLSIKKYHQLIYGSKQKLVHKKLLEKSITQDLKEKGPQKKWVSPYQESNNNLSMFSGQEIVPKKIPQIYGNSDPTQLKVLNLDRLFRQKQGKLTNVVPIPMVKLQSVTSRSNVLKTIKKKDKIHDVIQQYNKLLRIMQLKKTIPRIGVKGKNFLFVPTLQQLIGIKGKPSQKNISLENDQISQQIFINHCDLYKKSIKQDPVLTKRLINGLKQNKKLDLIALTRFYSIFINKIAKQQEKINFLCYFFIPIGQDKIQLPVLKLILQMMCQKLPSIQNLNVRTDLLSQTQKSKIFLQALHKVLFGQMQQNQHIQSINREKMKIILQKNSDAVDLLIKLLYSS